MLPTNCIVVLLLCSLLKRKRCAKRTYSDDKAVDNAGQESQGMSYCVLNLGDPLEDNVLYKEDFASDQWSKVVTNGVILDDGYIHAHNRLTSGLS